MKDLIKAATKVANWLERQGFVNENNASTCSFVTLKAAYIADAKNLKAMAKDLRVAIVSVKKEKKC
jgi:hypothetical protein